MVELLTERHVRALLKLKTVDEQLTILREIYEKDLNVKDTEYLITEYLEGRVVFSDETGEQETQEAEPKRQTIRRVFSDMRIYINTIRAAVTTIQEAGLEVKMEQEETDEFIQLTIRLPRIKK
jgi:ParB family chromosome partitioning protein